MTYKNHMDNLLEAAIQDAVVPGLTALIDHRDGSRYEAGFGEQVHGSGVNMDAETVLWLASMTKAVTGAAVMQQVEHGSLHLDQPASEICHELKDRPVLAGFDENGVPILRPAKGTITLRNLLTHTSGFVYDAWDPAMAQYHSVTNTPGVLSCENAALSVPLGFDPGTEWNYGPGIDWAGKMVERVTGQSLGSYMQEHLFTPLGMTSTGFRITASMRTRLATIHMRTPENSFSPMTDFELPQEPEFEMGGGGLYSTVNDYGRFLQMILNQGAANNGVPVLKPETVAMMSVNQIGPHRISGIKSTDVEFCRDVEFFPGLEKTWGLTFLINEKVAPTGRPRGSLAWCGAANTFFWIDLTNGFSAILATQTLPFGDPDVLALFDAFEKTLYQNL